MIIGGAQENTLYNCLDLKNLHGDDVMLVTGPSLGPEGDLLTQGRAGDLLIQEIPSLRRNIHPWHDHFAHRDLRRAIRDFQPDVVHTHSAKGGLLGRMAAHQERVPAIVHTIHGAPFHPYQSAAARFFFQTCERRAARWCHKMISVADAMTDLMVDAGIADRDKFCTIYSGMDTQPFLDAPRYRDATRAKYGINDGDIVIGKIARLFHLKGHDDIIDAASAVVAACASIRFMLVGDGILKNELVAKIRSRGLSDHFIFTGLVPPPDVPRLIAAMDALVHTSYREGLARALPQALIAGIPVCSYDIDGAREVVRNDETGYLVPPGDTGQLANRLISLAGDADSRRRMGQRGRELFEKQFRHQTMTCKIRELYVKLLENRDR